MTNERYMARLRRFCLKNGIRWGRNGYSYYFEANGKSYRVSNHTIEESRQKHPDYHNRPNDEGLICIIATRDKVIEIYNLIINGFEIDENGNPTGRLAN